MRVEETKAYTFHLPFMTGMVSLSVVAESQVEAARLLKEWFAKAQLELSMMFPQVAPAEATPVPAPDGLNKLQTGLIEDLAKACNLDLTHLPESILEATKLELTVKNFKKIVPILEGLRDTGKVIFPDNGKEKD